MCKLLTDVVELAPSRKEAIIVEHAWGCIYLAINFTKYVIGFVKTWQVAKMRKSHKACLHSSSDRKMSKSSFCHIHVKEPFY